MLEYIISVDLVFYALMVGAVFVMRRKAPMRSSGRIAPGVIRSCRSSTSRSPDCSIVDLAYLAPWTSGIGYLLVLTGVPVYLAWRKRDRATAAPNA